MKCSCTVDINAPADQVFEWIHDPEKHKQWLKGVEETRYLGEYNPADPVGTRFTQKIREGGRVKELDGEVIAFARPKHLGIRLSDSKFSVLVDYHLTPIDAGTRLDFLCDVDCRSWFFRIVGTLFRPLMKAVLRKQLRKLKELAEAGA